MLFCCNQELLGVEFLFYCCGRFHFCQLYHSKYQFHRARAPADRSEHQKYLRDEEKGMDFSAQKELLCVYFPLYFFIYLYIPKSENVCVIYLDFYIYMYVCT